jgi:hypothetical protein
MGCGMRDRVRVVTARPVGARCRGVGVTQGSAPLHPGLSPCAALRRRRARDARGMHVRGMRPQSHDR